MRRAIKCELSENIAKAGPRVQELVTILEALDDGRVLWTGGEIEVQKAPWPNARVWEDVPCLLSLAGLISICLLEEKTAASRILTTARR